MDLTAQERAEKLTYARRRCLTDLHFLITEVLFHHDAHKYGAHHAEMCSEVAVGDYLETNARGGKYWRPAKRKRSMHLEPRDHFKSSILVIGHLTQQILRNPMGSYLLLSGKDEHALLFSDDIRKLFAYNERLKALFPPWAASTPDEMGSKSEWTTPAKRFFGGKRREPTVVATGFKSRLESRHYNGGYLDDCMGEDDTGEAGLAEVRENYKKVIPLIDSDGFVIMPGTRKHYSDLYAALMETGIYDIHVRHGLQGDKLCDLDDCKNAKPHQIPDFTKGTPLEPKRMTRDDYEQKLRECQVDPKRGQSYFWHEYMNIPFSPTDRKFQPRWFVRVDDDMIPGFKPPFDPLSKWIAVDTALKDEEHPSGYDYNVVVVGGFDDHARLYILDILRSREWTEKKLGDAIITAMSTQEYGGISRVITEKVGETRLNNYLRDRARQAGIPLQIISCTRGGRGAKSKFERIVGCQGYFEQGRVFFRKKMDNYEDAVNEFCNLGRWTNDDIADAISMFYDEQVKAIAPSRAPMTPAIQNFRPMPYEGRMRRAGFHIASSNDPLGRFGTEGPAETRTRLRIVN